MDSCGEIVTLNCHPTPPPVGNVGVTLFTFMKWLKLVLAFQNIDSYLNIFHGWLDLVIVLAGLAAHGCSFRVYLG